MSSELTELQAWYESQCNGDWEHSHGIEISTLDNPGWRVRIDVAETPLAGREFREVSELAPEVRWMRCWVSEGKFHGAGGVPMLGGILRAFLDWARQAPTSTGSPAV
jgi:hypothetical protein